MRIVSLLIGIALLWPGVGLAGGEPVGLDPEQLGEAMFWEGAGKYRCGEALCKGKPGEPPDQECADKKCGNVRDEFSLTVTKVRYDGQTLSVEGKLGYKFKREGADKAFGPREEPAWLGLSVSAGEQELIDAPAQEIKAAKFNGPFAIKAKVGPKARSWVVGLWHQKYAPCQVDRPGCKQHGYVLGGPLAWEPRCAYRCVAVERCGFASCMGWNPVLPGQGPVKVQVRDAGGGAAWAKKAVGAANKVLGADAKLYGRKLATSVGKPAKNKRPCLEVLHKDALDDSRARVLAEEVLRAGGFIEETEWGESFPEHKVTHWPEAPVNFVIAVGEKCVLGG